MRTKTWLWSVCVTAVVVGVGGASEMACGTSDVGSVASDDGGLEASPSDEGGGSPPDAAGDAPSDIDAGGDASADADAGPGPDGGCGADDSACVLNGTTPGLCKAGACAACVDPTDDSACTSAYGSATAPFLCSAGVCTAGSCRVNADCKDPGGAANGQLCGLTAANTCSKCTADSQCKGGGYGATSICDIATGGCVPGTCATLLTTCAANVSDICCATAGGDECTAGTNCCSNADCSGGTPNCNGGTCSACLPVAAPGPFLVDPSTGSDAGRTGGSGACAFKTIKAAVAYVSALNLVAPLTATIKVLNTAPLGAGETFPIAIPAQVTITGENGAVPVLQVPPQKVGFVMAQPSSQLSYFTIDGQAHTALGGIVVTSGSSLTTTTLDHVTIQNMLGNGINVRNAPASAVGGAIAIGPGVVSTGNGTAGARASGLVVAGAGKVAISDGGNAAADPTKFDANTEHGIVVTQGGSVTIDGTPGATPLTTATVSANGNFVAGLWVSNTPGAAAPMNTVTGLTVWNTTNGNGVRVSAGSNLKLRSSSILGNAGSGIHVSTYVNGATIVDSTAGIDLGASAGDPGKNVLQAPAGMQPNVGAGICLAVTKNSGQALAAYGNTFAQGNAFVDCSAAPANPALTHDTTCSNAVDVSVQGPLANTNGIVTLACTQP